MTLAPIAPMPTGEVLPPLPLSAGSVAPMGADTSTTHTPPTLYELARAGGTQEGKAIRLADSGLFRLLGPIEKSSQLRAMHYHPAAPQINHP